MPIYLVRWPDLTASLVRADNEDELTLSLDQLGDPSGCTWIEYEGPLFLDLQLPVEVEVEDPDAGDSRATRPIDPAHIHIAGVDRFVAQQGTPLTIAAVGETGYDMLHEVMHFAFPATAAAYWDPDRKLDHETLEDAIREDAMRMVQHSWRQGHNRDVVTPAEIKEAVAALERFRSLMREINAEDAAETVAGLPANRNGRAPTDKDTELLAALDVARRAWIEDRDTGEARKALLLALLLLEGEKPPA